MPRIFTVFVCSFLTGLIVPVLADEAPVVRLPNNVIVNGDDADWKVLPARSIKGTQGEIAQFKLGYDRQSFYALVSVRDDSPLKNSASANDPAMLLKTGDAIGLTFGTSAGEGTEQRLLFALINGKPTAVVYRPHSKTKKPYSFESPVGKVTHEFVDVLPQARVAFKTTATGYNAEIQIPWGVLGYAVREGLEFPFDVQVILSDANGQTNEATAWWNSIGNGALTTVDLPSEARLYPDLWGKARIYLTAPFSPEKVAATPPAGGVPIRYKVARDAKVSLNVTDERGWIVRELIVAKPHMAGEYTAYWDGRDEYGDPLPSGKYMWKLLQYDGVSSKRIGGAGNSARPPFRTRDGKGDLGAVHGPPAALAADAEGIYHLSGTEEGNRGLTKLSPEGFAIWKKSLGGYGNGAAMDADANFAYMVVRVSGKTILASLDPKTGEDKPIATKRARFILGEGKLSISGLAVVGGRAYYGLPATGQIGVCNLQTGSLETPITVANFANLCRFDNVNLLVISGNQLLKFETGTGQTTPFPTKLIEPKAVARDSKGLIYVAQGGQSQQILQLSPQGQFLAHFGQAGGRPATAIPYDPNALRDVKSLCAAPDGNLWFMEGSELRRSGILGVDGKWVRDVYQTLPSQAGAGVDLDDPTRVFFHSGTGSSVTQARIDYATNAKDPANPAAYWKIEAVYNMTATGDYTKPEPDDVAAQSTRGPFDNPIAFTATNSKRYLWQEGGTASLWLKENGRLVPVHVIGANGVSGGRLFPKGKKFSWSDANGDGKVSADEIEFNGSGDDGWRWIDKNLTLYGNGGTLNPYKVDERGVPFYHRSDWKPDVTQGQPVSYYFRDGGYGIFPSPPAPDGARYSVFNIGAGQRKSFWDRATYSRIARIKDSKIQWIAGQHDGSKREPGGATYLWRPLGEVDGVMVVGDVDFQLMAYTNDGFGLGGITPHSSQGRTPENIVQENVQSGHFIKDPQTSKPMVVIGSGTEAMVLEVTGLEAARFRRSSGEINLVNSEPKSPPTAGQYSILYRTWPQSDNGRFLWVTGDGWGWRPDIPWLQIKDGQKHLADVRLRRDAGALHLYATVLDPTPLAQSEVKLGEAEGLELLIGPATPENRSAPTQGDTRFLFSAKRKGEKLEGVLVANRPSEGTTFSPITGAKIAARESLNGQGYHLEAEIPLSFLPELTKEREVTYIRNYQPDAKRRGDFNETYTKVRPDLSGPVRLDIAILQKEGSVTRRIPWVQDGQSGESLNPSKWGIGSAS